ncbi:KTSC domain-containing protein [Sphingomonas sp. F9_3S_D5_B_2]
MPSSVIRRFAYDIARSELWVEFVSGRRYVYEDVPGSVANAFRGAFAKGVYFNTRIRDLYRFRDVTRDLEAQPDQEREHAESEY